MGNVCYYLLISTIINYYLLFQGTQYFDSGEYAIQGSRKGKQEIALHPKPVFNPALARLHGGGGRPLIAPNGPQPRRGVPTRLATSSVAKVEQ